MRNYAWLAIVVLFLAAAATDAAARRPSVVVIVADDLGYADLGFQGAKDIRTPHLDRLAQGGVRCTAGYVSHPFCSPTRAGLMTARYQQRFGHETNPVYEPLNADVGLPLQETTVADVFRQAGYVTGAVGKWHLGAHAAFHPMKRGFSEYFGLRGGGHDYFLSEMTGQPREYLIPMDRNGQPEKLEGYLTDTLAREAADFVRRHAKEPFFLYLAFNAPHTPLQAPPEYLARYEAIADPQRKTYAAMISAMDDGIGQVLGMLDTSGIAQNTLVFFLSDNGGPVGINGSQNTPLRAGKGSVYEGGIRVPFVVRWPDRLPAGGQYGEAVISLDVMPTAAVAAGIPLPKSLQLDGVNLLDHLAGRAQGAPHEALYWRTGGGASAALRSGRYKLVRAAAGKPELYDLESDISETTDLAAREPERLAGMLEQWDQWNGQLVPPRWEGLAPRRKAGPRKLDGRHAHFDGWHAQQRSNGRGE